MKHAKIFSFIFLAVFLFTAVCTNTAAFISAKAVAVYASEEAPEAEESGLAETVPAGTISDIGAFATIDSETTYLQKTTLTDNNTNTRPDSSSTDAVKVSDIPTEGFFWPAPRDKVITSPWNLTLPELQALRNVDGDRSHSGIDIGGTFTVYAARSGIVVDVVNSGANMGTACKVVIKHEANGVTFYTRYFHLKSGSIVVKKNQQVKAGDVIGTSGNTGYSYGSHLHFEISTISGSSKKASEKLDPNPKSSFGVKYNGSYGKKTAVIDAHATVNYTTNKDEAIQLDAFQQTRTVIASKPYFISKDVTLRTYPADAAPKGPSLKANTIVVVLESGRNSYGNLWYKVRRLNDSKQFYLYSSYLAKQVTSSTIAKPAFSSVFTPSFSKAKTVKVELKSAAPSGCTYVAVYTCGSKCKTATFTGKTFEYNVGSAGYWKVEIYTKLVDNKVRVESPSISRTVLVMW